MGSRVYDLFAGIGGWEVALRDWEADTWGIDNWKWANATRLAAGFKVFEGDCDTYNIDWLDWPIGLVGSPPCQAFSQATAGTGLIDPRGQLVYEPYRWIQQLRPAWVGLEQVAKARPHFEELARGLQLMGYSTWCGMLNCADFGLPQARKRCVMLANRERVIGAPQPTVTKHMTMAEALPWRDDLPDWAHERPSMTVVGSFKPEVIAAPGYRKAGGPSRQNTPNSAIVSVEERLVLQGFDRDYPVQGPKTAVGLQVGNAIPPPLARAALRMLIEGK